MAKRATVKDTAEAILNHNQRSPEPDLYNWCLEQAAMRFMGKLSQEQIDKLNSINFPWAYYEQELDNLGFHWAKNNPNGKRWEDEKKVTA